LVNKNDPETGSFNKVYSYSVTVYYPRRYTLSGWPFGISIIDEYHFFIATTAGLYYLTSQTRGDGLLIDGSQYWGGYYMETMAGGSFNNVIVAGSSIYHFNGSTVRALVPEMISGRLVGSDMKDNLVVLVGFLTNLRSVVYRGYQN